MQCVNCEKYFHVKCQGLQTRGFHTKKASWKCKKCSKLDETKAGSETKAVTESKAGSSCKMGPSTSDADLRDVGIERLILLVENLTTITTDLQDKLNQVIAENKKLQEQVLSLKNDKNTQANLLGKSYAEAVINDKKVLIVNPKEIMENAEKTKNDLLEKVDPSEIGASFVLGKQTKKGGVILKCVNKSSDIKSVQNKIQ